MSDPNPPGPELFVYIRIVLGMVVSLGIARLLAGVSRFIQQPGRHAVYGVHLVWTASMLLMLLHFWWWEFSLGQLRPWHFTTYLFIVAYAAVLFLMCTILYPDDLAGHVGYRAYFLTRRAGFFGLLAVGFAFDLFDTHLKGAVHWASLGAEYPWRIGICIALCLLAAIVANPRFHAVFSVAFLVYQISWILRRYPMLG